MDGVVVGCFAAMCLSHTLCIEMWAGPEMNPKVDVHMCVSQLTPTHRLGSAASHISLHRARPHRGIAKRNRPGHGHRNTQDEKTSKENIGKRSIINKCQHF